MSPDNVACRIEFARREVWSEPAETKSLVDSLAKPRTTRVPSAARHQTVTDCFGPVCVLFRYPLTNKCP